MALVQAVVSSKPEGDLKVQELKQRCQSLCDLEDLDQSKRLEVEEVVRSTEEQWRRVAEAAEEALTQTESESAGQRQFEAFKSHSQSVQSWIKEKKKKLVSTGRRVQFQESIQVAQVTKKIFLQVFTLK